MVEITLVIRVLENWYDLNQQFKCYPEALYTDNWQLLIL